MGLQIDSCVPAVIFTQKKSKNRGIGKRKVIGKDVDG